MPGSSVGVGVCIPQNLLILTLNVTISEITENLLQELTHVLRKAGIPDNAIIVKPLPVEVFVLKCRRGDPTCWPESQRTT